jgi:hypothetical protein
VEAVFRPELRRNKRWTAPASPARLSFPDRACRFIVQGSIEAGVKAKKSRIETTRLEYWKRP